MENLLAAKQSGRMWGGDMHYENNYAISNNKLCQQETWLHT
jgi:hypothetical protein